MTDSLRQSRWYSWHETNAIHKQDLLQKRETRISKSSSYISPSDHEAQKDFENNGLTFLTFLDINLACLSCGSLNDNREECFCHPDHTAVENQRRHTHTWTTTLTKHDTLETRGTTSPRHEEEGVGVGGWRGWERCVNFDLLLLQITEVTQITEAN